MKTSLRFVQVSLLISFSLLFFSCDNKEQSAEIQIVETIIQDYFSDLPTEKSLVPYANLDYANFSTLQQYQQNNPVQTPLISEIDIKQHKVIFPNQFLGYIVQNELITKKEYANFKAQTNTTNQITSFSGNENIEFYIENSKLIDEKGTNVTEFQGFSPIVVLDGEQNAMLYRYVYSQFENLPFSIEEHYYLFEKKDNIWILAYQQIN